MQDTSGPGPREHGRWLARKIKPSKGQLAGLVWSVLIPKNLMV
ncbi:MAG: hypothetical protein ACHQ1H_02875 [Nitrososphaerales archaeon]